MRRPAHIAGVASYPGRNPRFPFGQRSFCSSCTSYQVYFSQSSPSQQSVSSSGIFSTRLTCSLPLQSFRLFSECSGGGGPRFRSSFERLSTRCSSVDGIATDSDPRSLPVTRKPGFNSVSGLKKFLGFSPFTPGQNCPRHYPGRDEQNRTKIS